MSSPLQRQPTGHTHTTSPAVQHIYWLGGWAVSAPDMQRIAAAALPQAVHHTFEPTPSGLQALRKNVESALANAEHQSMCVPIIAGYSTGAFLLLRQRMAEEPAAPLWLLAPFADFRAESGLGGKVIGTRLKILLRRLRNDPLAAVADFYAQSALSLAPPEELPYAAEELTWGIEQLAQTALDTTGLAGLKTHADMHRLQAWVGAKDALLDAETIAALFPPRTCAILPEATHDLASLLHAANAQRSLLP